ncbi:acyltransferase [Pseudalkalibacillus sp. JSM 102089]|uniref:acyltransferase n=1 Tax=Pseudalkalibacillus sp. JSM 102089 TaxID=3229856 RepID=UPI0035243BA7
MFNNLIKVFYVIKSLINKITYKDFGWFSYIRKPIYISNPKKISIGKKVAIWNGARIEAVKKYNNINFNPEIIIEDNVKIQQNFHCTCAKKVSIGKGTLITQNVGIFDIIHPYSDITISPAKQDINHKPVEIKANCSIGMNSVILPGTKLGPHTVVGANSVVNMQTEGYCVIAGSPAKIIKKYNFENNQWESFV